MAEITFLISALPPPRLDKALARDVPDETLSRSRLVKLIDAGAVLINGTPASGPKDKCAEGDHVKITLPAAEETHMIAQDIPLDILHEDDDLIVVNKPAGMVVHPAPGTPDGTLVNALLAHCGDTLSGVGGMKRPGVVHRIDKDTTGLLVVAKTDAAHHGLAAQFEKHTVLRRYQAICFGQPSPADPRLAGIAGVSFETGGIVKITTQLARHKTDRQKQAVLFQGGKHAVTRARVVDLLLDGAASLIECELETGRTHQIRVHLSYVGHALLGDQTYSRRRRIKGPLADRVAAFPRQALHAAVLGFEHPTSGEFLQFSAEMPADMRDLMQELREG